MHTTVYTLILFIRNFANSFCGLRNDLFDIFLSFLLYNLFYLTLFCNYPTPRKGNFRVKHTGNSNAYLKTGSFIFIDTFCRYYIIKNWFALMDFFSLLVNVKQTSVDSESYAMHVDYCTEKWSGLKSLDISILSYSLRKELNSRKYLLFIVVDAFFNLNKAYI